jgi:Peptidase family M23/Bacterial tandem repeat domain 1
MSAPNLSIDVEPVVGTNAVYLPLAAAKPGATPEYKLVLALRIENQESVSVTVTGIRYAFPGSSVAAVDHVLPANNFDDGPEIGAGTEKWWSNGVVKDDVLKRSNVIFRPQPAPAKVRVEITCDGYSDPATVTLPLAAHVPDIEGGGYRFPICTADLADDERLVTSARHWANGGPTGTQIFAHDLDVQRWDAAAQKWTTRKAGTTGDDDADHCGWGKPIRAMADGVVADDPVDGWDDTLTTDDGAPGVGNHVWITHGSERMLYPHLRNGSIPAEIVKGVKVYAGQMVGRLGSSGRASGPHIHMECRAETGRRLRPIVLRSSFVADRSTVTAPGKTGWVRMTQDGVPKVASAIWPESTTPSFRIPAIGIARDGDWANTMWISDSYDAFSAKATALHKEKGRRLIWVSTYVEDGKVRFVGIARDGDWGNTLYRSDSYDAFADKATELHKEDGRRLTCATTYADGGKRWFVGIARDGDWGNTLYRSDSYDAFADKATALHADGRRLTYATTYLDGRKRWFVGIARDGNWGNTLYHRGDLDSFRLYADQLHAENGPADVCGVLRHQVAADPLHGSHF